MLVEDPNKRIPWSDFFNHSLFRNIKEKKLGNTEKDLKHQKQINEVFEKVAKEVSDRKNDNIMLKDPCTIYKEKVDIEKNIDIVKPNNVAEGTIDENTLRNLEENARIDEVFDEYINRYLHERNKCHFIIKTVRNLRDIYKQIKTSKESSSIILTYLLLLKKA